MLQQLRDSRVDGSITFVYVVSKENFTVDTGMPAPPLMKPAQSSDLPVFGMMLRNYQDCTLSLLSPNPHASHEPKQLSSFPPDQLASDEPKCYVVLLPLERLSVVAAQLQLDTAESLFL